MILLVSVEEAKTHLNIINSDHDADVEQKIASASAIVMRHHKLDAVPEEWLDGSPPQIVAPDDIKAAVLLCLGELFANREASISNPLSNAVKSLIPRDPTLA